MSTNNESITIRVVNKYLLPLEEVTSFKIKTTTKLKKVFDVYKARNIGRIFHFTFNGERISDNDTAQTINIGDDGQIECCLSTNSEIVSAKLLDICNSDELTLDALQERINSLEPSTIHDARREKSLHLYTFFHRACLNKRITADIMSYLLEIFPEATSTFEESPSIHPRQPTHKAYPLHLACYHQFCPGSVIQLLIKEDPELAKVKGRVHDESNIIAPSQLPVYYYLSRNNNVDIGTVKVFVNADEQGPDYYPIHAVLSNSNIKEMKDILEYLVNADPSSLLKTNNFFSRKPLNIACENEAVNLDIVELIFNSIPEGADLIDGHNKHPIHNLCNNRKLDEDVSLEILRFMLDIDPTLPQVMDAIKLPIHYAVAAKSTAFCKVLIDAYPESVRVKTHIATNGLPIHEACGEYGDRVTMLIQFSIC